MTTIIINNAAVAVGDKVRVVIQGGTRRIIGITPTEHPTLGIELQAACSKSEPPYTVEVRVGDVAVHMGQYAFIRSTTEILGGNVMSYIEISDKE